MWGWVGQLFGKVTGSISAGYQAKKRTEQAKIEGKVNQAIAEIDGKTEITKANLALKLAKIEAKSRDLEREDNHIQDYDMQVLRNRERGYADEFIIFMFFFSYICHFLPWTQPYMATGWDAMGYGDAPPWWLEFGMVLILVSTLGGMRVLRMLVGKVMPAAKKSSPNKIKDDR